MVMAYIVMAYRVEAYVVMACIVRSLYSYGREASGEAAVRSCLHRSQGLYSDGLYSYGYALVFIEAKAERDRCDAGRQQQLQRCRAAELLPHQLGHTAKRRGLLQPRIMWRHDVWRAVTVGGGRNDIGDGAPNRRLMSNDGGSADGRANTGLPTTGQPWDGRWTARGK